MSRIEALKARCSHELSPHGADLVAELCALYEAEIERKDVALKKIAAWQRDKCEGVCESPGAELLFALLDMKIDFACAALAPPK